MKTPPETHAASLSAEEAAFRPLTDADKQRGMRYAYLGQSVGLILFMLFSRSAFGTLFIKHLGGSDAATMWVAAVAGAAPLVQIPLSVLIHPAHGKRLLLSGWGLYGVFMVLAALVPWAVDDPDAALGLTVGIVMLAIGFNLAGATFWFPMLHDILPEDQRGRFFGKLRATWSVLLFGAILGSGLFLGESPALWRFQVVIFAGAVLVLIRHLLIRRVPVPGQGRTARDDYRDWRRYLGALWRDRQVRSFVAYFIILGSAAGFLGQPLVIRMRDLGFSPRENMIVFGFTTLGTVVALYTGGHAVDRLGTKKVFILVHAAIVLTLVGVVAVSGLQGVSLQTCLALAFAVSGAAMAVADLACTTHLFHFAPVQGRVFFLALASVLLFLGPALATLAAGIVFRQMGADRTVSVLGAECNIFDVMLVAAAFAAFGAAFLLRGMENVRAARGRG